MTSAKRQMPARQQGVAMVVVLWMVSLLTIMAGSFSLSTQRNTALIANAKDRAKGLALADAGVHYALMMLNLRDPIKCWHSDGTVYTVSLPDGQVSVSVYAESGKIDINAASEQTLRTLLLKVTGDEAEADSLKDKIMDWRDGDDLKRMSGAESKEYQAEGKGYVPQNKNFQALEELQMVLGVKPALYQKLEPLITIYSAQDGINPMKASPEVLRLLFGMDEMAIAEMLKLRRTSPPNTAAPAFPVPGGGGLRIIGGAAGPCGGENAYTILAQSRIAEGGGAGVKAVARPQMSRNNGAPYAFVSWKQQLLGSEQNQNLTAEMLPTK